MRWTRLMDVMPGQFIPGVGKVLATSDGWSEDRRTRETWLYFGGDVILKGPMDCHVGIEVRP